MSEHGVIQEYLFHFKSAFHYAEMSGVDVLEFKVKTGVLYNGTIQ